MNTRYTKFWPLNWKPAEYPELTPGEKSDELYIASKQSTYVHPALAVSASETSVVRDQTTVRLRRRIAKLEEKNRTLLDCMKSLQSCVENDVGLWRMMDKVIRAMEEDDE